MEIIKYAGHDCVKCKVLDKVFRYVELPCEIQTLYVEDEGQERFVRDGVQSLPTLVFKEEGKDSIYLTGAILPKMITDAIETLSN